jgi:hypothetical protein
MMRRGRVAAARWNAAAEAARRWRLTLAARAHDAVVDEPPAIDRDASGRPMQPRKKALKGAKRKAG